MASNPVAGLREEAFSYGDHELQKLAVFHQVETKPRETAGYWIVYIHGGAWRDPTVTEKSILPAINHLLSTPSYKSLAHENVTGFASINYRLSPHPSHPQDQSSTPLSEYRNSSHPDHLKDVLTALNLLQTKFGFGSKYILVGHSCGATLALQLLMRHSLLESSLLPALEIQNPEMIVGVAGIYDCRLLRDNNSHPAYQEFFTSAFGTNEKVWDEVSPARFEGVEDTWKEGKSLILVTSKNDELVDEAQIDVMAKKAQEWGPKVEIAVWKGILEEAHNEIWSKGEELGRTIGEALNICVTAKVAS